jgi:hypothetical protein
MSMHGKIIQTIYGADGEHDTPYLTRVVLGRLRLHIFHRGDADPDPHSHPWGFWTFPLTSYREQVTVVAKAENDYADLPAALAHLTPPYPEMHDIIVRFEQVVTAFRWWYRPASHTHRVLGRVEDANYDPDGFPSPAPGRWRSHPGPIVTIVWTDGTSRPWGFLKAKDGRWCWEDWRSYVQKGGKHAPCEPGQSAQYPYESEHK